MKKYILLVGVLMLFGVASPVYADTPSTSLVPLTITPLCSDGSSATTYWNVINNNATSVPVEWDNIDNSNTGTYNAPSGTTQMSTYYDSTDPNNTTQFIWEGQTTQTNAPSSPCQPTITLPTTPATTPVTTTSATCIDGTQLQNLVVTDPTPDTATISTLNNEPLCADVTVYLSSYIMPTTYNGLGFYNNLTAIPQTLYNSVSVTLKQGTSGGNTLTVAMPNSCNNIQTDVYYAPEITSVGITGHGNQYITGTIYPSTGTCAIFTNSTTATPPPTVSTSATLAVPAVTTPSATPTPVVSVQPTTQLANTGKSTAVPTIIAVSFIIMALFISSRKVSNRNV
jgi:hypothetical protein